MSFEEGWIDLLKNNREWAKTTKEADPTYFEKLAASQVSKTQEFKLETVFNTLFRLLHIFTLDAQIQESQLQHSQKVVLEMFSYTETLPIWFL